MISWRQAIKMSMYISENKVSSIIIDVSCLTWQWNRGDWPPFCQDVRSDMTVGWWHDFFDHYQRLINDFARSVEPETASWAELRAQIERFNEDSKALDV